jgi:hypothetical protein
VVVGGMAQVVVVELVDFFLQLRTLQQLALRTQ